MKKLSVFINETNIDIQDNVIGHISAEDLKTYLKVTDRFISQEAKDIITWLIVNNDTYMDILGTTETIPNALAHFYNLGVPKDEHLKELYKNIGIINKKNRLLELPTFQTKDQFDAIISKKISPDEILLDLTSERGRNEVAEKYTPLVHKIAHSRYGKTSLSYEEILSAGFEGLTWAINSYGKKSNKQLKREQETGIEIDTTRKKAVTFLTFASCMIFSAIMEAEKNESNTVRIAISQQQKEKRENGRMTRKNTVSGEEKQGGDGDGKTIFDYIGTNSDDASYNLDKEDLDKLWGNIKRKLIEHFDKKTIDIFCSFLGLWNYEKMKNKDIAKKYGCVPGNITAIKNKVLHYINTDAELKHDFQEVWELVKECIHDKDAAEQDDVYTPIKTSNEDIFED